MYVNEPSTVSVGRRNSPCWGGHGENLAGTCFVCNKCKHVTAGAYLSKEDLDSDQRRCIICHLPLGECSGCHKMTSFTEMGDDINCHLCGENQKKKVRRDNE